MTLFIYGVGCPFWCLFIWMLELARCHTGNLARYSSINYNIYYQLNVVRGSATVGVMGVWSPTNFKNLEKSPTTFLKVTLLKGFDRCLVTLQFENYRKVTHNIYEWSPIIWFPIFFGKSPRQLIPLEKMSCGEKIGWKVHTDYPPRKDEFWKKFRESPRRLKSWPKVFKFRSPINFEV